MTALSPDLSPAHESMVREILRRHLPPAAKVWLFGSRARGPAKKYADLDLAVEAGRVLSLSELISLSEAFVESDLPFKVDIVDRRRLSPGFARAIEADLWPLVASACRTYTKATMPIRTLIWNEHIHERTNAEVASLYPLGIHGTIAAALAQDTALSVETATLEQPEHGLTAARLATTDVLIWWGHKAHGDVADAVVARVQRRVQEGMGLIVLHSAHYSKIFKALMGTPCSLQWREAGEKERLWVVDPSHPITQGLGPFFELAQEEMYGEPFSIPEPMETVLISWFEGGEVFRSGVTFKRGAGKVFYFRPGHETYPTYHDANVQLVLRNAVHWACNPAPPWTGIHTAPNVPAQRALEPLTVKGLHLHKPGEAGFQ